MQLCFYGNQIYEKAFLLYYKRRISVYSKYDKMH